MQLKEVTPFIDTITSFAQFYTGEFYMLLLMISFDRQIFVSWMKKYP